MKKIKVLQLQSNYNLHASDLAEQVIKALPSDQFEVTTAFLRGEEKSGGQKKTSADHMVCFKFTARECKGLRIAVKKALLSFCQEERFDVVIAHRFKPIDLLMWVNQKISFKCCIGIVHGIGDYDRLYRKFTIHYKMSNNWRFVGVSDNVKNYLLAAHAGFNSTNTHTINNAIDIEEARSGMLDRSTARQALSLGVDGFVFGTIGRLVTVKGHIYLIKAFQEVLSTFPNAKLVIVGGGLLESKLLDYIHEMKLDESVTLTGAMDDAYQYAKAFDVFVLPSLTEGLPLALMEAMAAELPVIGTDIPSVQSLVEPVGRIVHRRDVVGLASAMRAYLTLENERLKEEGHKAFMHLVANYSIEVYRAEYLKLVVSGLAENAQSCSV